MRLHLLRARWFWPVLGLVAAAAAGVIVWQVTSSGDEPRYGSFSAPVYGSIEDLATAADVIVEGTVEGVAGRELDYGTANPAEQVEGTGVPFVFYNVTVVQTLKGHPGDRIIVGNVDGEKLVAEGITPLRSGEQVLLFLIEQTSAEDSPGLALFDAYYTTLSLDAGVFDVLPSGDLQPRFGLYLSTGDSVLSRSDVLRRIAGS
jgi:hypothetical protein